MPPELQQRVHEEVQLTKRRSGWPVRKTLSALGVSRTTYYRWLREEAWAKARPDQIWATDIKYVWVGGRHYFLVCFLDEYSRYIVHHELLWGMDGPAVSLAAQAALETLAVDAEGRRVETPAIRSDNGSCYIPGSLERCWTSTS
jgi:transposase InsO family protein